MYHGLSVPVYNVYTGTTASTFLHYDSLVPRLSIRKRPGDEASIISTLISLTPASREEKGLERFLGSAAV